MQAVADAAHKAGIIGDRALCDGPTLLMLIDDLTADNKCQIERADTAERQVGELREQLETIGENLRKMFNALEAEREDLQAKLDTAMGLLRRVVKSGALSFEQDAPQDIESLEADVCESIKEHSDFLSHLRDCAEEVADWPRWKREILKTPSVNTTSTEGKDHE